LWKAALRSAPTANSGEEAGIKRSEHRALTVADFRHPVFSFHFSAPFSSIKSLTIPWEQALFFA